MKQRFLAILLVCGLGVPAWGQNADFDGDGIVGFLDFFMFADVFGLDADDTNRQFDMDRDGSIGFLDFFRFADNFGKEADQVTEDAHLVDPILSVSRRHIGAVGPDPTETIVELKNTIPIADSRDLTWTITEDETWLKVTSPQGDTSEDGTFSGEGDVELTVHTGGIGASDGIHEGIIQVRSNGGDVDIIVRMEIGITPEKVPGGKVLSLDGDGDWVEVAASALSSISRDFSVEMWVKYDPDDSRPADYVIGWRMSPGDSFTLRFSDTDQWGNSGFHAQIYKGFASYEVADNLRNDPDIWNHVSIIYNGNTLTRDST